MQVENLRQKTKENLAPVNNSVLKNNNKIYSVTKLRSQLSKYSAYQLNFAVYKTRNVKIQHHGYFGINEKKILCEKVQR